MIRVEPKPEPPDFDANVRQPGKLATSEDELPVLWRRCLPDLYDAYGGICAYACTWIPPLTGGRSVDHFAPKSAHPDLAYEWSNYRLVCSVMNARKREFEDVIDPFDIPPGEQWFELELAFLQVRPAAGLDPVRSDQAQHTIDRLKLNDPECQRARLSWYEPYLAGECAMTLLERRSPFVAQEVRRQSP